MLWAAMIYCLKATTAIGYSPYGQNRRYASPRHLPFFTTTMMREIFRALYVSVCLINFLNFLMPGLVKMPDMLSPPSDESDLRCLIMTMFDGQNYGPQKPYNYRLIWNGDNNNCPSYSHYSPDNNLRLLEMGSFLKTGFASDSDLAKIVSDPCLKILVGGAIFVDLQEVMEVYARRSLWVGCMAGNTTLFDTYRSLLDHQKTSIVTECLKISNVLVNAPFSRWAEELSMGNDADAIEALRLDSTSPFDQVHCLRIIHYVYNIVHQMESQGLTWTPQYVSLAHLHNYLEKFHKENPL